MIKPISQIYNLTDETETESKEVLREFVDTLVWRYENRYKTKVLGMFCSILSENGNPVGTFYSAHLMNTLVFGQDMITAQICEFTETKEILIKANLRKPAGTYYIKIRLITKKSKKYFTASPNLYDNVATQKFSKSLQETLENIDMEIFASHYSQGYRAKF